MKILFLDIETAPHLAHVWGLWKQNIGTNMLIEGGYMLSWAAKWYEEDEIFFSSLGEENHGKMVRAIHKLLTEADVVVHYNGTKFDIPVLNQEFIQLGLKPPAPFAQVDLLKTCRTQFRFPSNKLEYVVKALGIGEKGDSGGFKTWVGCMEGDPQAWANLKTYNIQDILILEALYERLRPWIKGHANRSTYSESRCCPICGSSRLQKRGVYRTQTLVYDRFQCRDCGKWSRARKTVGPSESSVVNI